jgi:hypothetical protein
MSLNYAAANSLKNNDGDRQEYEDHNNLAFYLAKANKNQELLEKMNNK